MILRTTHSCEYGCVVLLYMCSPNTEALFRETVKEKCYVYSGGI